MPIQTAADSITNVSGGSPYAFKNRLINGDFRIWQRGTSSSSSGYLADRWFHNASGTYARSTDVPTSQGFKYSLSNAVTTGTAYGVTLQRIESVNCYDLGNSDVTLSFWLKSVTGSTGYYAILYYPNSVDDYSAVTLIEQKSFSVTTSWAKYTLTYKNISVNAVNGLQVYFFSADGAVAPSYLITGIQLEKGSVGTGFDFRPFGTELQLCQRYFEKSFEVGTVPADTVGILTDRRQGVAFGSTSVGYQQEYKVSKRTAPSMTLYKGLNGGTNGRWGYYDNSTWVASTGATITNSENEFRIDFVVSGRTFGQALILDGNWTASAEL
jgi:hypothetical protein